MGIGVGIGIGIGIAVGAFAVGAFALAAFALAAFAVAVEVAIVAVAAVVGWRRCRRGGRSRRRRGFRQRQRQRQRRRRRRWCRRRLRRGRWLRRGCRRRRHRQSRFFLGRGGPLPGFRVVPPGQAAHRNHVFDRHIAASHEAQGFAEEVGALIEALLPTCHALDALHVVRRGLALL